ncbi:MAG TPA: diguanylate cyclase, partial [Terriglobales bacterium]|nr:diguanylate cyclase [Terriglobales bacterium]
LDEVLDQMLVTLRDYFHLRSGAVLLVDRASKCLHVRADFSPSTMQRARVIPVGKGIIGSAARLKRPVYVANVRKEPRYIEGDPNTQSELAIPLLVRDEVVGVLDCQSDQLDAFDDETVDLLTLFATNAAIALQNSELYTREQRRTAQLEAIYKIAKQTTSVLDLQQLLETMCPLLIDAFTIDHVTVFLIDAEGRMVLRREHGKLKCRVREGEVFPTRTGYPLAFHSFTQASVENELGPEHGACEKTGSEVSVPLVSFGQRLGLLVCSSEQKNAFHPDDIQSLESVADILAIAIQNAGYVEKVRMQANLDGLTGIFNRRYFEAKIQEKMAEAERYTGKMSLLMLDIDRFKSINDEFGHLLGDEVLRQVSAIISHNVRRVDLLCRYGGEEYAIIAPATTEEHAAVLAGKLRSLIERHEFPGIPRAITASFGIAEFPTHATTRDDLVRAADSALYHAKQSGRNRVSTYSELPATNRVTG